MVRPENNAKLGRPESRSEPLPAKTPHLDARRAARPIPVVTSTNSSTYYRRRAIAMPTTTTGATALPATGAAALPFFVPSSVTPVHSPRPLGTNGAAVILAARPAQR